MLVFGIFLTIVTVQLLIFALGSFPLYVVTNKISPSTRADHLLDRIDKDLPNAFCNVTSDCGECRTATVDIGIIESQHFPNEYSANLNCLFTLKAPIGKKIRLTFTEFIVKKCCDFITVFDGLANPLQVGLSGNDIPANVTSPSNQMTIKFTSNIDNNAAALDNNASSTYLGPARWQATYTFV